MKKQPVLELHMPEDLFRKMLYLCEAEHRTPNNQFLFMLRNNIQYFEKTKGRISPSELASVDITPYVERAEEDTPAES